MPTSTLDIVLQAVLVNVNVAGAPYPRPFSGETIPRKGPATREKRTRPKGEAWTGLRVRGSRGSPPKGQERSGVGRGEVEDNTSKPDPENAHMAGGVAAAGDLRAFDGIGF